ncbi:MAG TPA: hypothetical protein VE891_08005 [Allosphingosinicella sp.]|nr:hypothetical protein [Allosphingosinicella sp.]
MPKGRNKLSAAFAASIWLAASGLPATPAAAQENSWIYDGSCRYDPYWRGWYRNYVTHREPCNPSPSEYYGTCVYEEWSDGWYRYYVTHAEPCDPPA